MKAFWKTLLGSTLGMILGSVIMIFVGISMVSTCAGALMSMENTVASAKPGSVLELDMTNMIISEQETDPSPLEALQNVQALNMERIGILKAVQAIDKAAEDPNIKYIYLRADAATSLSNLEEIRGALENFRLSGKAVIAYIETPSNASYYLASVADRIYMSKYHGGMNQLVGLSGQLIFVKDMLDFAGVNMQLIRHGKYKAAGEMYIRNSASAENMEQNSVMIKSLWNSMVEKMVKHSGMTVEHFNSLIDNLELVDAECFLREKLVDELVDRQQMLDVLCKLSEVEEPSDIPVITLSDYAQTAVTTNLRATEKIAIIYADGEIIDGYGEEQVAGKRFAQVIDKVAADSSIKAVVLRVNSPGGSVVAASQIKTSLDNLHKSKPIIASYGSYAASGGYWISACSDYIFSDATCITGSIGVFGLIPDFSQGVNKWLRTNVTSVPSNKHSDMYGTMRPLTAEEVAYVQKDIEHIYTEFTELVAAGRHMSVQNVDNLGQGRVWTGTDALANGLVDEIGGLKDAVNYARLLCGDTSAAIESYPAVATLEEQIMQMLQPGKENYLVKLASSYENLKEAKVFVKIPYEIEIR